MKIKFLPFCFIISVFLLPCGFSPYAAASDMPDCNIDAGHCIKKIDDAEIIFDINPKPVKAMKELFFTVTIKGKKSSNKADNLLINLGMPGMYMGKNSVKLVKTADGTYKGKGVIPRCPSGRKLWRATVYLSDVGNNKNVDFIFNVLY